MTDTNNAAQPVLTDDELKASSPFQWLARRYTPEVAENMLREHERIVLSKLRTPKPLGDSCHHCGWLDWVSQDGKAYCQACGKPHGSVPAEGLPNLPELLRENADLDAAEGGNPDVIALEWAAADEIERLRREVSKLRAPVADERAPTFNAEDCNKEVYERGTFVGLFDIPKHVANELCAGISSATGARVDWHYFGGRVRVLALASAPVAGERAAFEAFQRGAGLDELYFERHPESGQYMWTATKEAWETWQARAALASVPVAGEAYQGDNVAERLDNMADDQPPGSQAQSDLYAAATIWRKHIAHRAAPQASRNIGRLLDAAHTAVEILDNLSDHADAKLASVELSNAAAAIAVHEQAVPQASEAVRQQRAGDPSTRDRLEAIAFESVNEPNAQFRHWWRKGYDAALSAQPGAQKEQQ